jgi:hypothetical protein
MTTETPSIDDLRSVRLAYLGLESAVKSLGQLCYLVAFVSILGTVEFALFAMGVLRLAPALDKLADPSLIRAGFGVLAVFMLIQTAGQWALGHGLTRLRAWARWTVVALTALSLVSHLGFCIALCFVYPFWSLVGLIVGGGLHVLILYPLITPGAAMVFSPGYKEVVRATSEIRVRMHWAFKLGLGLILGGVFVAVIGIYFWIHT